MSRWRQLFAYRGVLEASVTGRPLGLGFVCFLGHIGCWCSEKGGNEEKVL